VAVLVAVLVADPPVADLPVADLPVVDLPVAGLPVAGLPVAGPVLGPGLVLGLAWHSHRKSEQPPIQSRIALKETFSLLLTPFHIHLLKDCLRSYSDGHHLP